MVSPARHEPGASRSWVTVSQEKSEFRRLRSVVDALVRISEHAADTATFLDEALETVTELTRATGAAVILHSQENGLRVASAKGQMTLVSELAFEEGHTLARACLTSHVALHCDDSLADERIRGGTRAAAKLHSLIATPLRYGSQVLGVLEICSSVTFAFDGIDAQAVALLGNALGGALGRQMALDEHARLLERLEDALQDTQATARKFQDAALYDALTGLPNRAHFEQCLEEVCGTAGTAHRFAVLFIDLDDFKPINDTHGHATGDAVLRDVGTALRSCVRDSDLVARLGGDEFVVLVSPLRDAEHDAEAIAASIRLALRRPRTIDGVTFNIESSVGWVVHDGRGHASDILAAADAEMYRHKKSSRAVTE